MEESVVNVYKDDKEIILTNNRGSELNLYKFRDDSFAITVDNGGTERAIFNMTPEEMKVFKDWMDENI